MNRVPLAFLLAPFLPAAILLSPVPARADSDPEAVVVAEHLMDAMGGRETYDNTRYLTFRWGVERDGEVASPFLHSWDKWTGDYVLEGTNREGKPYRVVFNVNDRTGAATVDGVAAEGEQKDQLLEYAYGRFINDTYWLLMPWKWLDPGVNLAYEGIETIDGNEYDKVKLSFGDVGLTSSDVYWAYVSRRTGLMERWAYVLQDEEGNPGAGDPSVFAWTEWTEAGDTGLRFSLYKPRVGGEGSIAIKVWDLVASDDPPADWPFPAR